ncbi:SDR family oxidoreductase [Aurantimonas sp. 22II-16-19i]|uniref:SDR family oxidoreductase n=1 Tax=Aurantimonas sp. 22II-16-19i TaxID=1317114 RepID=UPI0009F7FAB5|nr:SDR family oxidoreductase [Aurantimonas sp. 22II-16-19i]ORE92054.1 short chain dehydrogenase/reductase oxidoreductase [Aurantimonas sp. 22II-16-19i]
MTDKPLVAITGASSGIGAATARAFAKDGHPLLLMARRRDRMEELDLPNAHLAEVDVRDRDAVAAAVTAAEERFGPTDVMFANAGIARLGNLFRQDPAEWDESIDINAKGVMNSIHPVMNGMKERRRGTIFMMSSIAGRKIYPDHTVYCGTKFFVHAISESLRAQLAPHDVRVVVLSPGIIETEVLDHVTDPDTLANYRANKQRIEGGISADHVAEMILFAYRMPQNVLIQEMVVTPTRQEY